MNARRRKSKKRSAGSEHSPSPPENFVLYLDENLCNSKAIQEAIFALGMRFERHLAHHPRGTPDETWLPFVGKNGWLLLTADKNMRYNFIERRALQEHRVREFVFASGNMSGQEMAEALKIALRKMLRICRRFEAPFVAAITRTGDVHIRWPSKEANPNPPASVRRRR